MNDTNPTRRGTVLPYRAVIVAIWIDFRAKSDATFRRKTLRGGFGPESPLTDDLINYVNLIPDSSDCSRLQQVQYRRGFGVT